MGKPAARLTDTTAHGGLITGPGCPSVFIGKMPAACLGDLHLCPMVTPGTPPIPHVGGPVTLGSTGVFIGKKPAVRMGDAAVCVGPPSSVITGCMSVLIGETGSSSQAVPAGSAAVALSAEAKDAGQVRPIMPANIPAGPVENNSAECFITDSAGRPLSGVNYRIVGPDNAEIIGTAGPEGRIQHDGFTRNGGFKIQVSAMGPVRWNTASGGQIKIETVLEGVEEGTEAVIQIFSRKNMACELIHTAKAYVRNKKVEYNWDAPESEDGARSDCQGAVIVNHLTGTTTRIPAAPPEKIGAHLGETIPSTRTGSVLRKSLFVEVPDVFFNLNSAVPVLDNTGVVISVITAVFRYAAAHPDKSLILFGHTDTSGDIRPNYGLSGRRACAVKALLDFDETQWVGSAAVQHSVLDCQTLLNTLTETYGWSCHAGLPDNNDGPLTRQGVRNFQVEYNSRFCNPIDADGIMGPQTWRALFQVLCQILKKAWDARSEGAPLPFIRYGYGGRGWYACGASFPVEHCRHVRKIKASRRVEAMFFNQDEEPELQEPASLDTLLTTEECPVYDDGQWEKEIIEHRFSQQVNRQ